MASLKRKRDESEDSKDDEPSYGKQILPVANLPNNFDKPPADGMEYLFTVRCVYLFIPCLVQGSDYLLPQTRCTLSS